MKTIRLFLMYTTLISLLITQGYSAQTNDARAMDETGNTCAGNCEGNKMSYKTSDITFRKDKIYEVAYITIKEGQEKVLSEEYFPKAFPIAAEYGVKKLATFAVTEVTGGKISPKLVMYFEWPSIEAYKNAVSDERLKKLFPIRDNALSVFERVYYQVAEDVTVTFREDKVYEIMAAWLKPNSQETLKKYFEIWEPIKQRVGPPEFKTKFSTVEGAPVENLKPHMAGIIEWNSTQDYFDLMADKEFQEKAEPLLKSAVDKMSMVHAKFVFAE